MNHIILWLKSLFWFRCNSCEQRTSTAKVREWFSCVSCHEWRSVICDDCEKRHLENYPAHSAQPVGTAKKLLYKDIPSLWTRFLRK